jgi:S-adenosylmethionine:tRNA ribosyltransferase-isomerase
VRLEEFDYHLPEDLIAQTPLHHRSDSRLMIVDPVEQTINHGQFENIEDFLHSGDVLVFNNSKVLPARLYGIKADTGAKVELLLTRPVDEYVWEVMAKPAKRLKKGTILNFYSEDGDMKSAPLGFAEVAEVLEEGLRIVNFSVDDSMERFLDRVGSMPLPPYIHAKLEDRSRYQTVYAKTLGSVAAPTAGLHFTEELMDRLRAKGVELHFVTLHVGIGTFKPVQAETVEDHVMHKEVYEVTPEVAKAVNAAKRAGRRIIAVGTTALRTLESAVCSGELAAGQGDTDIFIYPGYKFQMIDALITNFHLPKSTLLMLVSTLLGTAFTRQVYAEAVSRRYRFFSFGDAMFITRGKGL